jgi:hypothetical protein
MLSVVHGYESQKKLYWGLGTILTTMSLMNCSRNDVVLLPIPFSDLTSRKVRPAIVIGKQRADVFVVPISSQLANTDWHV